MLKKAKAVSAFGFKRIQTFTNGLLPDFAKS
jgi:hypothetical protein